MQPYTPTVFAVEEMGEGAISYTMSEDGLTMFAVYLGPEGAFEISYTWPDITTAHANVEKARASARERALGAIPTLGSNDSAYTMRTKNVSKWTIVFYVASDTNPKNVRVKLRPAPTGRGLLLRVGRRVVICTVVDKNPQS